MALRRMIPGLLALLARAIAMVAVACGDDDDDDNGDDGGATAEFDDDFRRQSHRLHGRSPTSPSSSRARTGTFTGFDMELLRAVAG